MRAELHQRLLTFARRPAPADFDALALDVARYQVEALPAYGRFVAASGGLGESWQEVPPIPSELFAELDLCSVPPRADGKDKVFKTSGTTQGEGTRGKRRVPDLSLYDSAMAVPFINAVLAGDRVPRRWLSLVPHPSILPTSSLSHMIGGLAGALASESIWALDLEGLDLERARAALSEGDGPVIIVATAFALFDLLEGLAHAPRTPKLPPGSRLMVTGGFKGRSDAISEDELLARVKRQLGIGADAVVPEYGMTELSSQAYGRPLTPMPSLRLRVIDPLTGKDLPPGEEGLVAAFDVLNLDNVSAILTSDLGVLDADGRLTLRGRLEGSMPRGCSLTAEELRGLVRTA